jgi:hypothetical protein
MKTSLFPGARLKAIEDGKELFFIFKRGIIAFVFPFTLQVVGSNFQLF